MEGIIAKLPVKAVVIAQAVSIVVIAATTVAVGAQSWIPYLLLVGWCVLVIWASSYLGEDALNCCIYPEQPPPVEQIQRAPSLMEQLHKLQATSPNITVEGASVADAAVLAAAIRELGAAAGLQLLSVLRCPALDVADLSSLASAALSVGWQLGTIHFEGNIHIGDNIVQAIAEGVVQLQQLHLENTDLGPAGLAKLTVALRAVPVQNDCRFESTAATSQPPPPPCRRLRLLSLSGNPRLGGSGPGFADLLLTSSGHIENMPTQQTGQLRELRLAHCGLLPNDIRSLSSALPYSGIRSLELAGNKLGSLGLLVLATAQGSSTKTAALVVSKVEDLGLERNEIQAGDEGLFAVASACAERVRSGGRPLRLRLEGNGLSPEDIAAWHGEKDPPAFPRFCEGFKTIRRRQRGRERS